jgi:hypothetical protein
MHNAPWCRVRRGAMDWGMIDIDGRHVRRPGITASTVLDAVECSRDSIVGATVCSKRRSESGNGVVRNFPLFQVTDSEPHIFIFSQLGREERLI